MPTQKRPRDSGSPPPPDAEKSGDSQQGSENHIDEQPVTVSDFDSSSYSSGGEKDEFIIVKLAEVRKEVQCPICLGIIRKTRTVMECLHRFCRECIDKSMRLGNNECPACRTHCASRRSLRDDPNYDALIAALYPDIDKYEEEQELAFHEEERARNKQIQASISQTFRRQAEALGKKRTSSRATSATFSRRQGNYRNLRGRRNRVAEHHESDEEEGVNGHDDSKDTSSVDEHYETKGKRYKRWGGARTSQPSPGASADDANDSEVNRGLPVASATPLGSTELVAWGRGGIRSNTRHAGVNWFPRSNRLLKLTNRLKSLHESNEVLKISLMIVSLHEEKIPSLKRPYLYCSPTSSVRHLCQEDWANQFMGTEAEGHHKLSFGQITRRLRKIAKHRRLTGTLGLPRPKFVKRDFLEFKRTNRGFQFTYAVRKLKIMIPLPRIISCFDLFFDVEDYSRRWWMTAAAPSAPLLSSTVVHSHLGWRLARLAVADVPRVVEIPTIEIPAEVSVAEVPVDVQTEEPAEEPAQETAGTNTDVTSTSTYMEIVPAQPVSEIHPPEQLIALIDARMDLRMTSLRDSVVQPVKDVISGVSTFLARIEEWEEARARADEQRTKDEEERARLAAEERRLAAEERRKRQEDMAELHAILRSIIGVRPPTTPGSGSS